MTEDVMESSAGDASAPSKARGALRMTGWVLLALALLLGFTVLKIPEARIKNYVQGMIAQALAPKGITLSPDKTRITRLFGLRYTMEGVTIHFPPPRPSAQVDKIEVSPSLLPFLIGRMGGKLTIVDGDGELTAKFSMTRSNEVRAAIEANEFNLGKSGILPAAAGVTGSVPLTGKGNLQGNLENPQSMKGEFNLDIGKIVVDAQTIGGFAIPRLGISNGKAHIVIDGGKALLRDVRLGKVGSPSDSIALKASGDMNLGKQWEASTLNVRAHFSLSPDVLKSFAILDALLGAGKNADGSYAFKITGPVYAPAPTPDKQ